MGREGGCTRKTIERVMSRKVDEWLGSITDESVRKLARENSIVTGGSIANLLIGERVKDYDIYFRDKETTKAVAEYYVKQFNADHPEWEDDNSKTEPPRVVDEKGRIKIWVKSAGIAGEQQTSGYEYFEDSPDEAAQEYVENVLSEADDTDSEPLDDSVRKKYRPVYMSANAITLSDKVQLVVRFYGEPEDIHKNYDFVHCMNYWTSWDRKLTLEPRALESLLSRQLQYQGSLYPVCSVIRTRKFMQRGWYINAGQYLKMCFQISGLDLSNLDVLEEQLTGVDAAYFRQVIDYCRERQEREPEFKPDGPYLVSIIDRIFG